MKTVWDYSNLASSYYARPDYSQEALDKMFKIINLKEGSRVCDVGAGVGHLTIPLAKQGFVITAVEPNDEMRKHGIERTSIYSNVHWIEGVAEDTKQKADSCDAVFFGSSFNVCDKEKALLEAYKICRESGWFVCMWNHRDLSDVHQEAIENIIKKYIADYNYGDRRVNQTDILNQSSLIKSCVEVQGNFVVDQLVEDCITAWKSHGTLARQAGENFNQIIEEIQSYLRNLGESFKVPYQTKIWVAQFNEHKNS